MSVKGISTVRNKAITKSAFSPTPPDSRQTDSQGNEKGLMRSVSLSNALSDASASASASVQQQSTQQTHGLLIQQISQQITPLSPLGQYQYPSFNSPQSESNTKQKRTKSHDEIQQHTQLIHEIQNQDDNHDLNQQSNDNTSQISEEIKIDEIQQAEQKKISGENSSNNHSSPFSRVIMSLQSRRNNKISSEQLSIAKKKLNSRTPPQSMIRISEHQLQNAKSHLQQRIAPKPPNPSIFISPFQLITAKQKLVPRPPSPKPQFKIDQSSDSIPYPLYSDLQEKDQTLTHHKPNIYDAQIENQDEYDVSQQIFNDINEFDKPEDNKDEIKDQTE
ncbi:MAG: hypothetical protein EZS28_008818 [Streblomastix strix]|uniref:Uncharacterized protein n=1 Tax=Streblomastix strix TaxID=222440 RepID=A0A5J4WM07_9EUKA|nr:MAG: hypothetical protein EZS28_008818 [Streblomastix strix]